MYKQETLKKYYSLIRAAQADMESRPIELLHIHISIGNSKIGKVLNVSIPPVLACRNCIKCKEYCYDIKACMHYPKDVLRARVENYVLLKKDRERYFAEIAAQIRKHKSYKFFRWHVAGDIVDMDYLIYMVVIAKAFPEVTFWTYTKCYDIVNCFIDANGKLPKNFTIMFSEWRGMPMNNPHNLPEFRVVFKDDEIKPRGFYCPGNCDICKAAHRGCIAGETTFCHEH